MKVLLIVDVQNDFCPGGALAVREGDLIVPTINELIEQGGFDLVIATQDWHPKNHGSFASNHPGREVFSQGELGGQPQTLWPDHCVQGSAGAELHKDLAAHKIHYRVKKGLNPEIDSYSGFFDNAKGAETELLGIIKKEAQNRGVSLSKVEIAVVGLATDYCVKATAIDAAKLSFRTSVIVDASRAVNLNATDEIEAIHEMRGEHVQIAHSRDYLRPLPRTPQLLSENERARDIGISL